MKTGPQIVETILLDSVTFDRLDDGREVARRGLAYVGTIIPNANRPGGCAYRLTDRPMPMSHFVASRTEGRAWLVGAAEARAA
jgi:hypothetical protein